MPTSSHTLSPSNGASEPFRVPWNIFVQAVLSVTIKAYKQMCKACVSQLSLEEDALTAYLTEDYIAPLGREHPLNLIAWPQSVVYQPEMKTGETTTRKALCIDIRLFLMEEDYSRIYFTWECKRICPKQEDDSHLVSEYVTEGILRFINEKYSVGLDDAGMLAYVISGNVDVIVDNINQSMISSRRNQPLSNSDNLKQIAPIDDFTDVYQSHHTRILSQSSIQLHHLFLTFDWPEESE